MESRYSCVESRALPGSNQVVILIVVTFNSKLLLDTTTGLQSKFIIGFPGQICPQ